MTAVFLRRTSSSTFWVLCSVRRISVLTKELVSVGIKIPTTFNFEVLLYLLSHKMDTQV